MEAEKEVARVDAYIVKPAQNGWILEYEAQKLGMFSSAGREKHTILFGKARDLGKFFASLDEGRKQAIRLMKATQKRKNDPMEITDD